MLRPTSFAVPLAVLLMLSSVRPAPAQPATASASKRVSSSAQARPIEKRVDDYLRPIAALDIFQGTVLIARGDRILLERGYGPANLEHDIKNSPGSVFRIASLSKVATDVALGALIESGRLRMSDSLARFLPDFPRAARITIEHLHTHRSGIPNWNSIPFDEEARGFNSLDSLVRAIAKMPPDFEPGARRRYSNGGYAVLARVIEVASGLSYADYMRQAVLDPLGMAHTRHEEDGSLVPKRASGYMVRGDARHGQMLAPFQQMATKQGGGSLISTTRDLHRLLRAMYRDNVIRAGTWWSMFPRSDSSYSFQGRCPGYNVFMKRDFALDMDVVVLANNYSCGMVADIGQAMIDIAAGKDVALVKWSASLPADSVALARWAGWYQPPAGKLPYGDDAFELRWKNGGLLLYLGGEPRDFLLPQADGSFLARNMWGELRLPPGAAPGSAVSVRPLWFRTEGEVAERVEGARP